MVGSHLVLKKKRSTSHSAKVLKLSVESDIFGPLSAQNISCLISRRPDQSHADTSHPSHHLKSTFTSSTSIFSRVAGCVSPFSRVSSVKALILWEADVHMLGPVPFPSPSLRSMAISLPSVHMQTQRVSLSLSPSGALKGLSVCLLLGGIVSLSHLIPPSGPTERTQDKSHFPWKESQHAQLQKRRDTTHFFIRARTLARSRSRWAVFYDRIFSPWRQLPLSPG